MYMNPITLPIYVANWLLLSGPQALAAFES
jgi:hypothetical protein